MSVCVELQERHRRLVPHLRGLLTRPTPADREAVASSGREIIIAFVLSYLRIKQHGFDIPFAEVAESVADDVCAFLLRMKRGPPGRDQAAVLTRNLHRRLARRGAVCAAPDPDGSWLAQVSDEALYVTFRGLLFDRAERQLGHVWKDTHGPGRKLLRSLKRRIRGHPELGIVRRRNGQFVCGPRSDRSVPPMTREEIAACLPVSALGSPGEIIRVLAEALASASSHGGYCYLMDLVHVVQAMSLAHLAEDPGFTGAVPNRTEDVSMSLLLERTRARLERKARDILESDAARRTRRARAADPAGDGDEPAFECWVAIAAEMVLRRYDAGRPEWDGISQRTLLERLLPEARDPARAAYHNQKVTYLVSRLRRRGLKEALA